MIVINQIFSFARDWSRRVKRLNVKRENQIVYYILHIRFRCQKISNVEIFVLVRFAFLSYRFLSQSSTHNKHLLFYFKVITVISVEL